MSKNMTGEELRAIRLALGLTQVEFAEKIGISRTYVGLMERGERLISRRTASAIVSVKPKSLRRQANDVEPLIRRIESALIEQGIDFETEFHSDGQMFDFYLQELSAAIVLDEQSTANPRPTKEVRSIIVARGAQASTLLSILLEGRPLRWAAPLRLPISV